MTHSQTIEDFLNTLFPLVQSPWVKNQEGTVNIVSRICHGAPWPYTHLDQSMKFLAVTIESIEHQDFHLSLKEVQTYPKSDITQLDYKSSDGRNIYDCIKATLISTWKSTGYGRLSIKSKKHRSGKIEVFVGETISHRFLVDPRQLGLNPS
jgi:hypothetical protein